MNTSTTRVRELIQFAKAFSLAVAVLAIVGSVNAATWTGTTATPPASNVSRPINISATSQTKTGSTTIATITDSTLTVGSNTIGSVVMGGSGGVGSVVADRIVTTNQFCIGTSCITAWPDGTGGTPVTINLALTETVNKDLDSDGKDTVSSTSNNKHDFCVLSKTYYDGYSDLDATRCSIDGAPGTKWTLTVTTRKGQTYCQMMCFDYQ